MARFHDDKFDGIVLKIPSWFININEEEMAPLIAQMSNVMGGIQKSMFHPDYVSNLYELGEYKEKQAIIEADKEELKKRMEARALIDKEFYERRSFRGCTVNFKESIDSDYIRVVLNSGEVKEFDVYKGVFSGKMNIVASFKKFLDENVHNIDIIRTLEENRLLCLQDRVHNVPVENITRFYFSHAYSPMLTLEVEAARICRKKMKNSYRYGDEVIEKHQINGRKCFDHNGIIYFIDDMKFGVYKLIESKSYVVDGTRNQSDKWELTK